MLDFSFPQTSQAVPVLLRKIEQQYKSLRYLIDSNQDFFDHEKERNEVWKCTELKKMQEATDGEPQELVNQKEGEIMAHYEWNDEYIFYMENNFYHSTFILAFSYFESIVSAMCKEKSLDSYSPIQKSVENLLNTCNKSFSEEIQPQMDYVLGNLRHIRNMLTHNYNGTSKDDQEKAAKEESEKRIGFTKADDSITIERSYVAHALDAEYDVLKGLFQFLNLELTVRAHAFPSPPT